MSRILKNIRKGLKYATYLSISLMGASFCYYQYIHSVLGPILLISKEQSVNYYITKYNMTQFQASKAYYETISQVVLARLINYHTYSSYCNKLNHKILYPALQNYNNQKIIQQIDQSLPIVANKTFKNIKQKIDNVKKVNQQNLQLRQYIIKQITLLQRELQTPKVLHTNPSSLDQLNKIQKYLCEIGYIFKDKDILSYLKHKPEMQKRNPYSFLHKLFII